MTFSPESPEDFTQFICILDIREPELYAQDHLPGALQVSREALLEADADTVRH